MTQDRIQHVRELRICCLNVYRFLFLAEEASGICRSYDGNHDVHGLSGSSGTLFSPDYPVTYPGNAKCVWTITVPVGKRVKLKLEDLDLKTSDESCKQQNINVIDSVQIGDGLNPREKGLAIFCDEESLSYPEVYSSGRSMWVKFYSNLQKTFYIVKFKGFKARFEAVDQRKYYP